jgi:hypothetical protein
MAAAVIEGEISMAVDWKNIDFLHEQIKILTSQQSLRLASLCRGP